MIMSENKGNQNKSLFDSLISELLDSTSESSMVDVCLSGDQKAIRAVPLRYRLIALGFIKRRGLDEVNASLRNNGCAQLYARSLIEATLIYAFSNGLSYEEWRSICVEAESCRKDLSEDSALSMRSISLNDIRAYVMDSSTVDSGIAATMHKTRIMQESLTDDQIDRRRLGEFLLSNITSFCSQREKSRYYFCKYLMYFLESRRDNYVRALASGRSSLFALEGLSVFKSVTALKRKKHSPEEAAALISEAGISAGNIYQAFQDFYFEYTSSDWLDILLEKYSDIDSLSTGQKKTLASYIRRYRKADPSMTDEELLLWQRRETERRETGSGKASYQEGRAGENYLRKVLRGETDPDRTTLIAFLVFFDSGSDIPEEHRISRERIDGILAECGFDPLNEGNYSDEFFMDYMEADDPVEFLIGEAEMMAMSEENFYLYKTYLRSGSASKEWDKITRH